MQRRLIDAYDQDAVSAREIGDVLRRYDRLDADARAEFDDLIQHEGIDAVSVSGKLDADAFEGVLKSDFSTARKADIVDSLSEVDQLKSFSDLYNRVGEKAYRLARHLRGDRLETLLRRTDPDTQDILADGSGDLDKKFDREIAKALADDDVDNNAVQQAVKQVDDLEDAWGTSTAQFGKRLVVESPDSGSQFLRTFDDAQIHKLSTEVSDGTVSQSAVFEFVDNLNPGKIRPLYYETVNTHGISMSQLAEFIDSSDGCAARLANDLGGGKLAGAIELDPADRDILTEVAYKESLDGTDALASDSLTARDILDMSEDTDLQSVKMIAKSQGGKVIRLESGQDSFDHILDRHFRGTAIKSSGEQTTFFPSGKTASARGGGPEADLPSEVSQDQIAPLLREAIEETSTTDGSFTVTFSQPRSGITKLNIETEGDLIASAYPKEGPEVRRWNWDTGEWEQWSSSGWTRWEKPYNQAGNSNQPSMTPGPLPTNPSQQYSHLTIPSASQELSP